MEGSARGGWSLWPWPFFAPEHQALAERVLAWTAARNQGHVHGDGHGDDRGAALPDRCRALARSFGAAGLLDYVVPASVDDFDVRSLCLIREALTYDDALADAIFAMQGIGTIAIQQFGSPAQQQRYLPGCRSGAAVAAFALTEPEAGSDVASMTTRATRDGADYILDGDKTLISNAGFADHYIVIARTGEAPGTRGLTAFVVDADSKGLSVGPPIDFIATHPAASLHFDACRVKASQVIGAPGQGFTVAMAAFDIFRPSVGAAAVGLARRALDETLARVTTRQLQGKAMAELQTVQMTLAEMASDIDLAALAVYRAAWSRDVLGTRGSYAPSMAKLAGAEAAGRVVDRAVQLWGGAGVTQGQLIEQLYREARPMRIYEGASEVQKLIIAKAMLKDFQKR